MAKENLREIAAETLIEILEKGSFSHLVIKNVLDKYAYLDKAERSFINRLCNGTIERKLELTYIINSCSKTKANKMKPLIRTFLLMGAYEIYYMDSVPESATCNEYVKLAKKRGFSGLSGFVNGVLRGIARTKGQVDIPDVATKYSIPEWMYQLWEQQFGESQAKQIAAGFYVEQPLSIRVNTALTTVEELTSELTESGIVVEADSAIPYELYISSFDRLATIDAFKKGKFYVQDHSSMLVGAKIESRLSGEDLKVIDCCAAPGGKSLHIAELIGNRGSVEARDLTASKVELINENIERTGATNVVAKQWDATVLDQSAVDSADVVVADLPCSGLGIIRKKPDIKYRMDEAQIAEIEALQAQILDVVCQYVKAGGTLIYSTCTINKGENDNQVAAFLEKHSEFSMVESNQLFPDKYQDGFYICVMQKKK